MISDYLKTNGPVLASNYLYKEVQGSCKRVAKLSNSIATSIEYTLNGDENLMKNILAQDGESDFKHFFPHLNQNVFHFLHIN